MAVDLADWTALAGNAQESVDCWAKLVGRWIEPHRRYHGIGHLSAVLLFVDDYADHADDADAVRLAAWYHDAIYDPQVGDNEERSAVLAETELAELGVRASRVTEVARLVRLTAGHDPIDGDRNGELLSDADLLVLASPSEAYVAYLNAIRAEYAHVSDADFRAGRAAVLANLLTLPRIYRLESLAPMDAVARRNMTAELSLLRRDPSDADEAQDGAAPPGEAPPGSPAR